MKKTLGWLYYHPFFGVTNISQSSEGVAITKSAANVLLWGAAAGGAAKLLGASNRTAIYVGVGVAAALGVGEFVFGIGTNHAVFVADTIDTTNGSGTAAPTAPILAVTSTWQYRGNAATYLGNSYGYN